MRRHRHHGQAAPSRRDPAQVNWSNETVRAARRSKFMCALVLALRKVPDLSPGGGYKSLAIRSIRRTVDVTVSLGRREG